MKKHEKEEVQGVLFTDVDLFVKKVDMEQFLKNASHNFTDDLEGIDRLKGFIKNYKQQEDARRTK